MRFPYIFNKDELLNIWLDFALTKIEESNLTLISIDPLKINENFDKIDVFYSGYDINPEDFIKSLSFDIVEQMNKHLVEIYMDNNYSSIDIEDPEYNIIFDNIEMEDLYNIYPYCTINIPIIITTEEILEVLIYGIIKTNYSAIDIIDDIRQCLISNDTTESFEYNKDDIIYKYGIFKEIDFTIIINSD